MSSVRTVICVVFLTFFTLLLGQNQFCNNAYECVGTQWILSISQTIYGSGYKSLSGINTSITTAGSYVYCGGAFACTQISFILDISNWGTRCFGSHSCTNIAGSSYIKTQVRIYCYGANACENSNIITSNSIHCNGDQSCIHSNITSANVYAQGAYSLYGASIYISNAVRMYGFQSGYGSTIKCISGNTCDIYCYGNACQMALVCPENSNCNIILSNNDPTITIPPIQNINDYNYDFYDMKYESNILTLNNEYVCNNATQFVYDNKSQKQDIIDMNQQNGGPVCCRGKQSCLFAGRISFTATATTSDILVCSGYWSCYDIIINTPNPVFCEGFQSCQYSTIHGADEIYCLGGSACLSSVITKSINVYCSGHEACHNAQIQSSGNDTNIYLLGIASGKDTNISCGIGDKCEITCGGYQSCIWHTVLHCNNNCNVYCNTDTGCPNGDYTIIMPTPSPTSVTSIPTTSIPTTSIPTTSNPTTSIPTTSNPTTLSPTQRPSIPPTKARETTADGFFEIVNYNNKKGDGNIYNWWLIITLIILLVLSVGGIIIGVIFYKRNKNKNDSMVQNVEMTINKVNATSDGNDDAKTPIGDSKNVNTENSNCGNTKTSQGNMDANTVE